MYGWDDELIITYIVDTKKNIIEHAYTNITLDKIIYTHGQEKKSEWTRMNCSRRKKKKQMLPKE